ncbi:phospholipase [Acetobacter estunensis]|nr:phospholipase [Acetobacter estunensis]
MPPDIRYVIVLMLENRSFDCMLGQLYTDREDFDGLKGTETNTWHDGKTNPTYPVRTDPTDGSADMFTPNPDPGEQFTDIAMQIHGKSGFEKPMSGFIDNYMSHAKPGTPRVPDAVMHYFTQAHVPAISELARAFAVSDRWFASAPCQTWPNRLFVHTGSAGGDVNNTGWHVPYMMQTTFERVAAGGKTWGIYFHDVPQTLTLGRLWPHREHFHPFQHFLADAKAGSLPSYSFIEPRYFADPLGKAMPNDQHPPHNVGYGDALIADVYNALRSGPGWKHTLFVITYDEHGGCYDHVAPGPAVSPGGEFPDGFRFDYYGVRVPAVIVSPFVKAKSVIRPTGTVPFDHTTIFRTLQDLFGLDPEPLTPRTASAPSLVEHFAATPDNLGPSSIDAKRPLPSPQELDDASKLPPNGLQEALAQGASRLPSSGTDPVLHVKRLGSIAPPLPVHTTTGEVGADARAHVKAFRGE